MTKEIWEKLEQIYGERRKKEEIEEKPCEDQCSTNDKAKDEESSGSQSLNERESCFIAFEEIEVTSNSCNSTLYTFDELQDAFEELAIDFDSINLRYKKMISKLSVENELLTNAKIDLEKKIDGMRIKYDELKLNLESS